jgi:hypothetical protein
MNKKVMIGVETLDTTPVKVTFFGKRGRHFEAQLALAESAMTQLRSFGGFVVPHLKFYRVLVEEEKK